MDQTDTQSQESIESFGWEWTERTVTDSTRTAYHGCSGTWGFGTIITTARLWRMSAPAMAGMFGH